MTDESWDDPAHAPEPSSLLLSLAALMESKGLLLGLPLAAGAVAVAVVLLLPPIYTARTTFLPPQQQNSAATAIAALGGLAALAGNAAGLKAPADQYVSLMTSNSVADRLSERFDLGKVYDEELRVDIRKMLAKATRVDIGKRDGLISVEVDDEDPRRAADLANAYVDELRAITGRLELTEAQQRRAFFEKRLTATRQDLARAQQALQASGFNASALKAEPRAAADAFARLRAELTAAETRLGVMRSGLADGAPEVRAQLVQIASLRAQMERLQQTETGTPDSDYVSRYREFKYQESLFEVYARQFELARADEAREGGLIQVVDMAQPPEKRSRPRRLLVIGGAMLFGLLTAVCFVLARERWRHLGRSAADASAWQRLNVALGRRIG